MRSKKCKNFRTVYIKFFLLYFSVPTSLVFSSSYRTFRRTFVGGFSGSGTSGNGFGNRFLKKLRRYRRFLTCFLRCYRGRVKPGWVTTLRFRTFRKRVNVLRYVRGYVFVRSVPFGNRKRFYPGFYGTGGF